MRCSFADGGALMCMIFGWAGHIRRGQWRTIHQVLHELFHEASSRNPDATGFAALTQKATAAGQSKLIWEKWARPASAFTVACEAWSCLRPSPLVICHTRLATHGDPHADNGQRNNHPFLAEDESLALVHNGIVRNHNELTSRRGLQRESECDSEVLLRLLESHADPMQGLALALREIQGSMAVAVLDAYDIAILLARNEARPLWLFRLRDVAGWLFASNPMLVAGAMQVVFGKQWLKRVETLIPMHPNVIIRLGADGSAFTFEGA